MVETAQEDPEDRLLVVLAFLSCVTIARRKEDTMDAVTNYAIVENYVVVNVVVGVP